ncbi:MAG: DUF1080 domain-containing protein [Planctomycetaceae bacterium]
MNTSPIDRVRNALVAALIVSMTPFVTFAEDAAEKDSAEFTISMFDGKSLDGWVIENGTEVTVQDGAILLKGGDGWLHTPGVYRDFQLHVEWMALQTENYDAGIYLRAGKDGAPFPKRGYQANMLQGKEGNIGKIPGAASTGLAHPAGEWNTFDITVIGNVVEMAINGQPAYKVEGIDLEPGFVGIQVEVPKGGQFLVRKFDLVEIGYSSLFNGEDFTQWEGADGPADACWTVKEGTLQCTGTNGPWLRSKDTYGDFNLRFDYQLSPGGNSGVYVRVPADGNHHRKNDQEPIAGFEVQVLDDNAPQYATLLDYQYSGSVYDIAGASPRVSKPAGEWNTLEINCQGQNITTVHNGEVIVNVTPEAHPMILLREQMGHLGLQNHQSVVKFRNLRIGPALHDDAKTTSP